MPGARMRFDEVPAAHNAQFAGQPPAHGTRDLDCDFDLHLRGAKESTVDRKSHNGLRAASLRLISTSSASFFYPLPSEYGRRIAAMPRVDAVSGSKLFFSPYRDPRDLVGGLAVDPEAIEEVWPGA